jgi:hypothetical protein
MLLGFVSALFIGTFSQASILNCKLSSDYCGFDSQQTVLQMENFEEFAQTHNTGIVTAHDLRIENSCVLNLNKSLSGKSFDVYVSTIQSSISSISIEDSDSLNSSLYIYAKSAQGSPQKLSASGLPAGSSNPLSQALNLECGIH